MKSCIAFLVLLAAPLAAQGSLWIVDQSGAPDADFTDLQPAIDAAADGDVLLVRYGTYPSIVVDGKSLAIVGSGPARPRVRTIISIRDLPAGGWFVLSRMETVEQTFTSVPGPGLQIEACDGPVRVEDCVFRSSEQAMIRVTECAAVDLTRCTAIHPAGAPQVSLPHGVEVIDSTVSIHESSVSAALVTTNESLFLFTKGGSGVRVEGPSFVFVSDSTLTGGVGPNEVVLGGLGRFCPSYGQPGEGGDALSLGEGDPLVVLRDVTLVPGEGGNSDVCPWTPVPGQETSVLTGTILEAVGAPRGFSSTTPVLAGVESTTLRFRGEPGDLAISLATTTPVSLWLPPYQAMLLVDPLAFASILGVVPEGGLLELALPVDPLPPGWGSGVLFLQGVAFDAALAGHVGSPALLVMTASS